MPIHLRIDYDAPRFCLEARNTKAPGKPGACWRWPRSAMASAAQTAAAVGGLTPQIVRDLLLNLNAGGAEAPVNAKCLGLSPGIPGYQHAPVKAAILYQPPLKPTRPS